MTKYRVTVEEINEGGTVETKSWEGPNALVCMKDETGIYGYIQDLSLVDIAEILENNETLSKAALIASSVNVKDLKKVMHPTEEGHDA